MRPVLRILGLWRLQAGWLTAGIVVSLLSVGTGVALLSLAGDSIAVAVAGGALVAPAALGALGIVRVVLRYSERLATHAATFRALAGLRVWFFRGLARRAAGGLGFRRAGDVLSRLVNDVDALDGLFLRIVVPLAAAVVLLPVVLVLIGRRDLPLAVLVVALLAGAAFLLPWLAARGTMEGGTRLATATAELRIAALDALSGLREVRAFGAEGRMLALVQARQSALMTAQHGLVRRRAWAGAIAFLLGQAAILAVLATAVLDPVAAVGFAFLTVAAFEVVGGLPAAGALAGHAAAAAARVLAAAADAAVLADPPSPDALPPAAGLRFEGVQFRWAPDRPAVFDGLTLDIPQGSRVAILGPSGAGKSSLAALALRVAVPQGGKILLGGADVARLRAEDVRGRIAWLSQATHLFDATIRANLMLARPDADDAALWAALAQARLEATVRALPDGLDGWVGEGGTQLSGGEGRRLALARALLSPAPVLILDEPCTGLDAATERAFLTTLNEVADGRSVILIAHRLTGVERLDRIYRLSGGRAVAAAA